MLAVCCTKQAAEIGGVVMQVDFITDQFGVPLLRYGRCFLPCRRFETGLAHTISSVLRPRHVLDAANVLSQ